MGSAILSVAAGGLHGGRATGACGAHCRSGPPAIGRGRARPRAKGQAMTPRLWRMPRAWPRPPALCLGNCLWIPKSGPLAIAIIS